jgi:hypothetical protein
MPKEDDSTIIEKITEIRAKNNRNWMAILKLAFKYAPEEATKIMNDITGCDAEINQLTKKLGVKK